MNVRLALVFVASLPCLLFPNPSVCMTPHSHAPSQATSPVSSDGERLFVGLFYADGPDASLLPTLVPDYKKNSGGPATSAARARLSKEEQAVVSQINRTDPGFFVRFNQNMRSGDVVQIEETLQEAVAKIDASLSVTREALEAINIAPDMGVNGSVCEAASCTPIEVIIDQDPPPSLHLAQLLKDSPLMQDKISANAAVLLSTKKH